MTAAVPDILRRLPREHVAKVISKPFDLDQLINTLTKPFEKAATTARVS